MCSAAQKDYNDRQRGKQLIRLLDCNFGLGDCWVTLTYAADPQEPAREMVNYLRRVKAAFLRAGLEAPRYVYVNGGGDGERAHHHLVISGGLGRDALALLWGRGVVRVRRCCPGAWGLRGLGGYLAKHLRRGGRYYPSHGLRRPAVTVEDWTRHRAGRLFAGGAAAVERAFPGWACLWGGEPKLSEFGAGLYLSAQMRRRC